MPVGAVFVGRPPPLSRRATVPRGCPRYCTALLCTAVPAGPQREGLNVQLPRESLPLEVATEV